MREQTRPEFEAYEKTVETALFNLQRSALQRTGQASKKFPPSLARSSICAGRCSK